MRKVLVGVSTSPFVWAVVLCVIVGFLAPKMITPDTKPFINWPMVVFEQNVPKLVWPH